MKFVDVDTVQHYRNLVCILILYNYSLKVNGLILAISETNLLHHLDLTHPVWKPRTVSLCSIAKEE